MAVTTIGNASNIWGNIRTVPSGHYGVYQPGPANTLILYSPSGQEVARNQEALRDFSLHIDPATGEIIATYTQFVDGGGYPIRRWATNVRVAVASTPTTPTPANNNAAIVASVKAMLDQIR